MLLVMGFDLSNKYITTLYFLTWAANYSQFNLFSHLANDPRYFDSEHEVGRVSFPIDILLHLLFWVAVVFAFLPAVGTKCYENNLYRKISPHIVNIV